MDVNALIQAELNRIEDSAAQKARSFLSVQDEFIAAHALADLLKKHGAPVSLQVWVYYSYSNMVEIGLYRGTDSDQTVSAIGHAGIDIIQVRQGFDDDTTELRLRGYENVRVYVDSAVLDRRNAA